MNSFRAMLGREATQTSEAVVARIRNAMLDALTDHCQRDDIRLDMAIRFAADVAELWYLRPDLMHAIAAAHSQALAQDVLRQITLLFRGHYSSANQSRFAALA